MQQGGAQRWLQVSQAMKWGTGHQDEVILAKEKTGIQLKQDAIKKENRKVKGCKAFLQRRSRSGWLWKTPWHYQLRSDPVGTRKTENAAGASSCSSAAPHCCSGHRGSTRGLSLFFLPPNLLAVARGGEVSTGWQSRSQERPAVRLAEPQAHTV